MQSDLDEAAHAFATWRATREKRSHTPLHLKQQAISLLGRHTGLAIMDRLGINQRMLSRWKLELSDAEPTKFIDITPAPPTVKTNASLSVTVDLRGGAQLMLSGHAQDIATLLLSLQQGGGL